jgi:2-polyprenyl-3-methyl-5-hydroxy-6-metoxy-1,4-benzoquinol methylase
MKLVKIPPPGTFCFHEAVLDLLNDVKIVEANENKVRFVEVGCGAGDLSAILLKQGFQGMGVDFSSSAIAIASENLEEPISNGNYELLEGDIMLPENVVKHRNSFNLALSMMVMEHVEDDTQFVKNLADLVMSDGMVMLAVPGRMDRWSIEDDTVGHLRRYENHDLQTVMEKAGLEDVTVWSVAVPVANILFKLGNFLVKNSKEVEKVNTSMREQTEMSGIREIPFKTVFPRCFRLILNKVTLYPLFVLQRLFYRSNLGLTMLAVGKVAAKGEKRAENDK